MVCYSHLLKNFPQFLVIHRVKGFDIVNKGEIDIFLNSLAFLMVQYLLLKPGLENFEYYFASV